MSTTSATTTSAPSSLQLQSLFISSAIPMCAFGFMDNLIMIQAGGYIDATFGATLGLATLSAAALGQVFSDTAGVLFGSTVERIVGHLHKAPATKPLSPSQRLLPLVKNVKMAGSVIGIIVGCLLGASSLLFVDLDAHERQLRTQELKDVVMKMVNDDNDDKNKNTVVHLAQHNNKAFDASLDAQLRALSTTTSSWHVQKAATDQVVVMDDDDSTLYVPIVQDTLTLGVLECSSEQGFSEEEQQAIHITAKHLAIFMERLSAQQ